LKQHTVRILVGEVMHNAVRELTFSERDCMNPNPSAVRDSVTALDET
jgi:hypothetical protein